MVRKNYYHHHRTAPSDPFIFPYAVVVCIHVTKTDSSSGAPKVVSKPATKEAALETAAAKTTLSQSWSDATSGVRGAVGCFRSLRASRAPLAEGRLQQGSGEHGSIIEKTCGIDACTYISVLFLAPIKAHVIEHET